MQDTSKKAYYDSLPRKRSAVGVLILKNSKLLVLEPTYKPNWLVPGGVVERFESPLAAANRECFEEIGDCVEVSDLLCVDYKNGNEDIGDAIHFLFLGTLKDEAKLQIDEKEIKSFQWLSLDEALAKFDSHLSTRVQCGLAALELGRPLYCEDGVRALP